MKWTAWTTLASLVLFLWMGLKVARARGEYKVKAPATDGPLGFQCAMRVQMNTLEQMITFLPALWMCAFFLNDRWAALGGAAWIVGRIAYALGYYKDPSKRSFGFMLTMFANIGLMCGAAVGLLTF